MTGEIILGAMLAFGLLAGLAIVVGAAVVAGVGAWVYSRLRGRSSSGGGSGSATDSQTLQGAGQSAQGAGAVGAASTPCPDAGPVPGMTKDEGNKALEQALKDQKTMLEARKKELDTWDDAAKARFKKWFGTTDDAARDKMKARIDKQLELNKQYSTKNFRQAEKGDEDCYGYVYPNDSSSTYLGNDFAGAPATGQDSKAGVLCHEMSHFTNVSGTKDHVYGDANAKELAKKDSTKALENADNFEYYCEGVE